MQFSAYFLLPLTFYNFVLCECKPTRNIISKNLPTLRQERSFRFPGFVILPALIVSPVLNNKQNEANKITIRENHKDVIAVNGTKLTLNDNVQEDNSDIEANFRQALERGNSLKKDLRQIKVNEAFSEMADLNNNGTTKEEDEVTMLETTSLDPNIVQNITTELDTTTEIQGFYSNSRSNNTDINSWSITIKHPDSTLYPPLKDEQWKNFTMSTNVSISKENKTEPELPNSLNTGYPSVNEPNSQIIGVYKAALYNNAEIDQLSITTNSYTNELPLPPPQDDRWSNFSSLKKMLPASNEFKPLAGLYYDGFLHSPVTKSPGFVPYNHYYFY